MSKFTAQNKKGSGKENFVWIIFKNNIVVPLSVQAYDSQMHEYKGYWLQKFNYTYWQSYVSHKF